jgi:AcrR family transcriptional regulator
MMEQAQREGLFWAMMTELAERGYREASIEGPMRAAGVSSAEFEAEFGDKDTCLFAAYDHLTERALERATSGCGSGQEWPERVRAGLLTLLETIAAEPEMAKAMTRSFPGIRPAAYERYVELLSRFLPFMAEGRDYSEVDEELPGEVELLAVGAAEAIIFSEVDAGRAERLPKMMPEILFSVLVPFMGPDRAADEMRNASAAI